MKKVIITNGSGGCGKDTFFSYINEIIPSIKYSSIDKVKEIAKIIGWTGGKTEKDRKFLSDLKLLTSEYNNMPLDDLKSIVNDFINNKLFGELLVIDIREPDEIAKAVAEFEATTVLIRNPNVKKITSNMADANVENYEYDYIIENNGTLDDLKRKAHEFVNILIQE